MNSNTGAIASFETVKDARKAGYDIPLSMEQFDRIKSMDRPQRLAWAQSAGKMPEVSGTVKVLRRFKTRLRRSR